MANIDVNELKNGNQETEDTMTLNPDSISDPPKGNDADKPEEEENPGWFKRAIGRVKDFGHEVRTHLPLVGGSALVGAGLGVTGVILLDRLLGAKTKDADTAEEQTDEPNEVPPALAEPFEAPEMVPIPTPEEREVDVD